MSPTREEMGRRMFGTEARLPATPLRRIRRTLISAWMGRGIDKSHDEARLAAFISSVGEMKGIAMKMGQIMSYIDVALPDDVRAALSALQTHAPPMSFAAVQEVIRDELGERAEGLLAEMGPRPIAAASIGQVHRARLGADRVAVKVQYPEVRAAIESDFSAARIGPFLAGLAFPGARIGDMIDEAKQRFLEECDYLHEAEAQRRFRDIYTDDPVLLVPAVHDTHTSTRVLTTDYVEGVGLDQFLEGDPPQALRDRLGEALFRFYIGTLFEHGLYNCDPHPGNYLFVGDRIALLDHGCTRSFDADTRNALARLARAVHDDDDVALRHALGDAGFAPATRLHEFDTAKAFLRAFHGPMLIPGRRPIRLDDRMGLHDIMQSKKDLMKIGLPAQFLFLLRIRFGLLAVLSRLGAEADWHQLERVYVDAAVGRQQI